MIIIQIDENSAELIGKLHSTAWKQAYDNIFPEAYLLQDTPEKREKECISTLLNRTGIYYLVCSHEKVPIGCVKLSIKDACQIESFYFLKEYQNKGYGTATIEFIRKEYRNITIHLWVLENNHNAISFYQKNDFINSGKKRTIFRGTEFMQLQFKYENH